MTWISKKWAAHKALREDARRKASVESKRQQHTDMVVNAVKKHQMRISESVLAGLLNVEGPKWEVMPYTPPKGVTSDEHVLAMDAEWGDTWGNQPVLFSMNGFPGFPYLTELTQITEYRDMSERTAKEMTRKWIKLRTRSGEDRGEEIKVIESELERLNARELFKQAATLDGFMGRAQIFMDLGDTEGAELETMLMLNPFKIQKGTLRKLKIVEPITTYPAAYNSSWPLRADYYAPSAWFVYGQKVHASRMLTFVSRPLPDLLKPVYNFSGMSLSQLARPYVDYWLNTRDSVGKLLRNFSTPILKTDLSTVLTGTDDQGIIQRAKMFNLLRDNQGLMMLDFTTESFEKHDTSLDGLDKLQAQAQEHMAAVAKTPLVILLGITPSGLNATAEGDLKIYYDHVNDMQEAIFRPNLETLLKIIMLSSFGEVLEDITFDFEPLMTMTGKEMALIQKSKTEEAVALVNIGAVSPEEVRANKANDPDSGWDNLDVDHVDGTLTPGAAKGGQPGGPDPEMTAQENSVGDARVIVVDANQHTDGRVSESKKDHASRALQLTRKAERASGDACDESTHRAAAEAHIKAASYHGLSTPEGQSHWKQGLEHIKQSEGWA